MKYVVVILLLCLLGCTANNPEIIGKPKPTSIDDLPTLEDFGPNRENMIFGVGTNDLENLSYEGKLYHLGLYHKSWGRFDEAKECFEKILDLTEEPNLQSSMRIQIKECSN